MDRVDMSKGAGLVRTKKKKRGGDSLGEGTEREDNREEEKM